MFGKYRNDDTKMAPRIFAFLWCICARILETCVRSDANRWKKRKEKFLILYINTRDEYEYNEVILVFLQRKWKRKKNFIIGDWYFCNKFVFLFFFFFCVIVSSITTLVFLKIDKSLSVVFIYVKSRLISCIFMFELDITRSLFRFCFVFSPSTVASYDAT